MNKLITSVSHKFIFNLNLSYYTKCILFKIVTDCICEGEEMNLHYLVNNIFGTWTEKIVFEALDELTDEGIMFIDFCDCDDEDECDVYCEYNEEAQILFNPKFLQDACPYLYECSCCGGTPKKFNIIYN